MAALSIEEQLVIAGLTIVGKRHVVEGYLLTHPGIDAKAIKPDSLYRMASRWFNREQSKVFRREVAGRVGTMCADDDECMMSDVEILMELTRAARAEADQSKKSQILMRLSDLKAKIAASDETAEDKRVIMYLPFNCDCRQCKLFINEKKRKENEE